MRRGVDPRSTNEASRAGRLGLVGTESCSTRGLCECRVCSLLLLLLQVVAVMVMCELESSGPRAASQGRRATIRRRRRVDS